MTTETETADPVVISTAIAEYSPTAAALADLSHRFRGVVFDVATTKGDKEARAARLELVKLRTGLESKRREIKAPALERSRLIDSEANRINAFIAELEIPIDQQIKTEEQRKEVERTAKIEAEQRRVASLMQRVESIRGVIVDVSGMAAAEIENVIRGVVALTVDSTFAEFAAVAENAKTETLAKLRELHGRAIEHEQEQARIVTERAELERLRGEQAKRDAEEAAARKVEEKRIASEQKAEADRLAAERRKFDEEQAAARAEQQRRESEARAEREEADRRARARAERDEQDRIAREARAAEQQKLDDAAAALREQQAQVAAEQRRREDEAAAEQRRIQQAEADERLRVAAAAAAARTKLQNAAQSMLDALQQWKHAEDTHDKAELANARKARDMAIVEAT